MALIQCKECGQTVSTTAYTCPHCGAPQQVAPPLIPPTVAVQHAPPLIPPTVVVQHAPEKKKGMGIFGGCLVVILIVFLIGVIGSRTGRTGGSDPSGGVKSIGQKDDSGASATVDLTARVRFTGTQIAIQNGDTFDWTNVKLEINSGLLSGGYVLNVPRMSADQEYTVGAMQFAKSDGERFNPLTHKPQKFTIWCDTPKGKGFYYGDWK